MVAKVKNSICNTFRDLYTHIYKHIHIYVYKQTNCFFSFTTTFTIAVVILVRVIFIASHSTFNISMFLISFVVVSVLRVSKCFPRRACFPRFFQSADWRLQLRALLAQTLYLYVYSSRAFVCTMINAQFNMCAVR